MVICTSLFSQCGGTGLKPSGILYTTFFTFWAGLAADVERKEPSCQTNLCKILVLSETKLYNIILFSEKKKMEATRCGNHYFSVTFLACRNCRRFGQPDLPSCPQCTHHGSDTCCWTDYCPPQTPPTVSSYFWLFISLFFVSSLFRSLSTLNSFSSLVHR